MSDLKKKYWIEKEKIGRNLYTTLFQIKDLQPVFTTPGNYTLEEAFQLWKQGYISKLISIDEYINGDK